MRESNFGVLYIVATPIGNLADISLRALETLRGVDFIVAENTLHSSKLLSHFGIKKRLLSYHNYNEVERSEFLLNYLQEGKNIALISDAGTPLISDPGFKMVSLAHKNGIRVIPIPGACAAVTALCASGIHINNFIFEGFLPVKTIARKNRLTELERIKETIVIYEAPHRLGKLIREITKIFQGDREIVIAKELTKKFEMIHKTTVCELLSWIDGDSVQERGEFVVLIQGSRINKDINNDIPDDVVRILNILSSELSIKQASALTSKITGFSKNRLYSLIKGNN